MGDNVGSYRIDSKLAEGGMGAVYRATHQLLGRPAAVKVLLPELSSNRDLVNRFFNEARSATAVKHPGIVEIYDFGYTPSGMAYIVMELLDGEPLSRTLAARGRLDEGTALLYTRGIASALAAAHSAGIVHRDLKPDNVFLVPDPDLPTGIRPKLLDFGIAKVSEAQRGEATKTRTGSILGTPTYMSPEQCHGAGDVDARSDLYSLGCILYEMVVGHPPFASEGIGEIIAQHLYVAPTPPNQAGAVVSSNLEALVLCLLAKKPAERIQSAAELVRMLGPGSLPVVPANVTAPTVMVPAYPTGVPTTLSGAAGQTSSAAGTVATTKRSRAALWSAIAVVVLGGGALAAVTLTRGSSRAAAAAPVDASAAVPVSVDAAMPAVQPAVPIDAGVVDAAPAPDAASPIDPPDDDRDHKRRRHHAPKRPKPPTDPQPGSGSSTGVDRGD